MRQLKPKLYEKLEEAFKAVLPVVGIVLLLCFGVAPVPSIPNMTLILSVAVGIFLVVALVRILFGIALAPMLLVLYAGASGLAFLVSGDFLAVAFDSGGVASGPMTAAFLLLFAMGPVRRWETTWCGTLSGWWPWWL